MTMFALTPNTGLEALIRQLDRIKGRIPSVVFERVFGVDVVIVGRDDVAPLSPISQIYQLTALRAKWTMLVHWLPANFCFTGGARYR